MPNDAFRLVANTDFVGAVLFRYQVFVVEQGFQPRREPDREDATAEHWGLKEQGELVSVLRVRNVGSDGLKIERMATRKERRREGLGKGLLKDVLCALEKRSDGRRVWLTA